MEKTANPELAKKMEKKNQNKNESTLFKIINSPNLIIAVLVLFAIGLMIYNRFLINSVTLYNFYAYEEDFSIMNGTIFVGYDVNYFGDSKISYMGEKMSLYDFEIGYYIKKDGKYYEISKMTGYKMSDDEAEKVGANLEDILNKTDFSFTEVHDDAMFLSEDNIKNIDNLIFRIQGIDEEGEKVDIEIPLEINKVTK